jgi:anaerobic selenocysteine-containing dehydrogenase
MSYVVAARGRVRARARITAIRPGVVFVPFHYGYWDMGDRHEKHDRAANELTITEWDPASK